MSVTLSWTCIFAADTVEEYSDLKDRLKNFPGPPYKTLNVTDDGKLTLSITYGDFKVDNMGKPGEAVTQLDPKGAP